ncbi:MAG TPA: D-alanyl-D-alanine carboxypeptidase family protein [Ktedonobacteraceae bacterium]
MKRRSFIIILLALALLLILLIPVMVFTPAGAHVIATLSPPTATPSPTPIPPTPTPLPTPIPVLTVRGTPPALNATASYLIDLDTGNILENVNGYKPLPMASTTKIMTALIAIESGKLDQAVTVTQAELDQVPADASSADLVAGETLTLRQLLYGLMLPSGDDAALVIANAQGGSTDHFVTLMNLFSERLHLFQTHYDNPHGLNLSDDQEHYTSASDLARLAEYAMHIPLFAQIVQTRTYNLPATTGHQAHKWINTDTLLGTYSGAIGIKTGHTDAAGWCLVFAATRDGHHLVGVVLNDPTEAQRDKDATALLNWGFALPMLPPSL